MRKTLRRLAVAIVLLGTPFAAQAKLEVRNHCTADGLAFTSNVDTVTGRVSVVYTGRCFDGPYTVLTEVLGFGVQPESRVPAGLNRYELATYRALTGPVPPCSWVEPSPRFRAEIARYRVRGRFSISRDQLSPSVALTLARLLPETERR